MLTIGRVLLYGGVALVIISITMLALGFTVFGASKTSIGFTTEVASLGGVFIGSITGLIGYISAASPQMKTQILTTHKSKSHHPKPTAVWSHAGPGRIIFCVEKAH